MILSLSARTDTMSFTKTSKYLSVLKPFKTLPSCISEVMVKTSENFELAKLIKELRPEVVASK